MTNRFVTFFLLLSLLIPTIAEASPFVVCISGCKDEQRKAYALTYGGTPPAEVQILPQLWLGPSVGLDIFTRDSSDNSYQLGARPAVGWGIKYKPANWTATTAVLALDLFASAGFNSTTVKSSFDVDLLPVFTFLDWVSFGIGYRHHFSTTAGVHDSGALLTSFGIRKALGGP